MQGQVADQEIAITILYGLLTKFNYLIVPIDAIVDDGTLTTDLVKSRLLQKEQQFTERGSTATSNDSALFNNSVSSRIRHKVPVCFHCHKQGHVGDKMLDKNFSSKPE